eukprot:4834810-Amphidinium_carterae.1
MASDPIEFLLSTTGGSHPQAPCCHRTAGVYGSRTVHPLSQFWLQRSKLTLLVVCSVQTCACCLCLLRLVASMATPCQMQGDAVFNNFSYQLVPGHLALVRRLWMKVLLSSGAGGWLG